MNYFDFEEPNIYRIPYMSNTAIVEFDGYGLYSIRLDNGITPAAFDGKFTSLDKCLEAIDRALMASLKYKKMQKAA